MEEAACMDHPVLDWFDDEHYQSCAKVCDTCTVRSECLEYAVHHRIDDGVWGGLVPYQLRKAIRARDAMKGRDTLRKRGTPSGDEWGTW
jgi:WhiB family transcriptional regulator, redox-sensing transcriptional regulator